jgi:hypothetical protein
MNDKTTDSQREKAAAFDQAGAEAYRLVGLRGEETTDLSRI